MASDEAAGGRAPRSRVAEQGFKWISSSPSPAEVARLEARFSDVVRVPEALLVEEMSGWHQRSVLARTFLRWVPAEAFIREFRRAGISGAIVPISLAYRCHIFRFEDAAACDLILNRPWVVNGQIVGTEAWKPEFFPAEDSISSALLWVRLLNLPMEFWKEDILRVIMEPAGSFFGADDATRSKNRGGFARVAVRVDLRLPLRPGTRVQELQGPFWQQFTFESMEGICPKCGSLHLVRPCSLSAMSEEEIAANGPVFGPWMAAVRQRRTVATSQLKTPTTVSSPSPASQSASGDQSLAEGWKLPVKVARMSLPMPSIEAPVSSKQGGLVSPKLGGKLNVAELVTVPVLMKRAGFRNSAREQLKQDLVGASDPIVTQSFVTNNPFASLGLVSNEGGPARE